MRNVVLHAFAALFCLVGSSAQGQEVSAATLVAQAQISMARGKLALARRQITLAAHLDAALVSAAPAAARLAELERKLDQELEAARTAARSGDMAGVERTLNQASRISKDSAAALELKLAANAALSAAQPGRRRMR